MQYNKLGQLFDVGAYTLGGGGIGQVWGECFVELFRQPDAQFQSLNNPLGFFIQMGEFGLTMGQILSIPMIIIGFILYFTSGRRKAV